MKENKSLIFGSNGLLGSAIYRVLHKKNQGEILAPSRKEVDLLKRETLDSYLKSEKPDHIYMVAGMVGGIKANNDAPADFLYANSVMILNLLESVKENSLDSKILYTGSTCIYPKENPQPINENRFLAGRLEKTNEGYAISKIMGTVACQSYRKQHGLDAICAMPTNLYGINDNYDLENGHMIASLIKKTLLAKKDGEDLVIWGTGKPRREALFSDDCADALICLMNNYSSEEIVNIGTGFDYSVIEFASKIKEKIGFRGEITNDFSKPDGTFEKRTDIARLKEIYPSFKPRNFEEGLTQILSDEKEVERILS